MTGGSAEPCSTGSARRHYISGPSAAAYLEEHRFDAAGISLEYMSYDYPEYDQLHPPFEPQVSIIDLLAMEGDRARRADLGLARPRRATATSEPPAGSRTPRRIAARSSISGRSRIAPNASDERCSRISS